MATGGRKDPLEPSESEPGKDGEHPDTEEHVLEDTAEVFYSYVRYRYHQEMEQGEQPPPDPEIMALQHNENSPMCRVGQQLAIIGDDINRRYDLSFTRMLSQLALTPDNAYEYFCKIANSLFDSGINWGRVIALLSFGYRMALHVFQQGITGFLSSIMRFICDFLLRNRIAQWIAQQGGWVNTLVPWCTTLHTHCSLLPCTDSALYPLWLSLSWLLWTWTMSTSTTCWPCWPCCSSASLSTAGSSAPEGSRIRRCSKSRRPWRWGGV
ncbi:bcl-2 homologous antagonist/killer [Arapaima gigas]